MHQEIYGLTPCLGHQPIFLGRWAPGESSSGGISACPNLTVLELATINFYGQVGLVDSWVENGNGNG